MSEDTKRSYPYDAARRVARAVMADHNRSCLYGVAGPCQHPKCLKAHFNTLQEKMYPVKEKKDE